MNRLLGAVCVIGILLSACSSRSTDAPSEAPLRPLITPDVVYGHKFGLAMTFDVFRPKESNGAGVIFVNSGGWRSERMSNFYTETPEGYRLLTVEEQRKADPLLPEIGIHSLLSSGFTIFVVRHGSSPKFEMSEIVSDMRRAVRFIRYHANDYGIDVNRLGLFGLSSGGHLALLLGLAPEIGNGDAVPEFERERGSVAAVVAYFPPTDLERLVRMAPQRVEQFPVLDLKPEEYRNFSPLNFVTKDDPPTLIIHGDADDLVPPVEGESIYRRLTDVGVTSQLIIIKGAKHGFVEQDADRAQSEMLRWFQQNLGGRVLTRR